MSRMSPLDADSAAITMGRLWVIPKPECTGAHRFSRRLTAWKRQINIAALEGTTARPDELTQNIVASDCQGQTSE